MKLWKFLGTWQGKFAATMYGLVFLAGVLAALRMAVVGTSTTGLIVVFLFLAAMAAIPLAHIAISTAFARNYPRTPKYKIGYSKNCRFSPEQIDLMGDEFVSLYAGEYGFATADQVRGMLAGLDIEWMPGEHFSLGSPYKFAGIMRSSGYVLVAERSPGIHIGMTSAPHEMTHCMLLITKGDSDPDHAHGPGPWTKEHDDMIEEMRTSALLAATEKA